MGEMSHLQCHAQGLWIGLYLNRTLSVVINGNCFAWDNGFEHCACNEASSVSGMVIRPYCDISGIMAGTAHFEILHLILFSLG